MCRLRQKMVKYKTVTNVKTFRKKSANLYPKIEVIKFDVKFVKKFNKGTIRTASNVHVYKLCHDLHMYCRLTVK